MPASPICTVKDGAGAPVATTNGVNVTAANTITIALVSVAGVQSWSITCIGTDELQVATTITTGLTVDGVNKTATFTMPAAAALGFRSTVVDVNGVSTSTQFGIYTLVNSLRVGFVGETSEGSSAFGYTATFNAKIRQAAGGGASLPQTEIAKITKTANYTAVAATDYLIICGTNTGFTITMPAAPADGTPFVVSNQAAGTNTVNGGGHNINGAATFSLAQYQSVRLTYDLASTTWIAT